MRVSFLNEGWREKEGEDDEPCLVLVRRVLLRGLHLRERESKQAKGAKEKETKREKKNVLRGTSVFANVCNRAKVPQALPTVHHSLRLVSSLSSADRGEVQAY